MVRTLKDISTGRSLKIRENSQVEMMKNRNKKSIAKAKRELEKRITQRNQKRDSQAAVIQARVGTKYKLGFQKAHANQKTAQQVYKEILEKTKQKKCRMP